MGFCLQCKKWVVQTEGKKKKEFCNSTCRSNYWYGLNKKQVKAMPPQSQYDGPKLPANFTDDEPLSFGKLREEIATDGELPSFEQLERKVQKAVFADEKNELIEEIAGYTHIPDKQKTKLLNHLQNQRF